ncbi:MAG TPA: CotH kinase family protein [Chryseosolibacter sp.]
MLIFFLLAGTTTLAQTFQSSNLPIVIITTGGQNIVDEPKVIVNMEIIDNGPGQRNTLSDARNVYNGKVAIELRGSSSRVLFPKKQYAVELRNKALQDTAVSLLGLPAEEDWILSAPYNDKTLMRDVLAYKLGRSMGRYAPRTKYCELVLNGNYQGVYFLNEKIKRDKNRVDISALNPDETSGDDLTGGYIIKLDKVDGSSGPGFVSEYPPSTSAPNKKITFQYEYPKWDEIVSAQKNYIAGYVFQFEKALAGDDFADPDQGYARYIDVDSFVDFFIMNELTKNVDGYRLSSFFYKQKDSQGGKLFAGPIWDFNLGFGNANYCTSGAPAGFVYSEFNTVCPNDTWLIPFWWERLFLDANFGNKVSDRWAALRQDKFSTSTIHAYIDSVASVLNQESQQRNFQAWPVLNSYVWPNFYVGPTFQAEVNWLKSWVSDRANWLDNNLPKLVTSLEKKNISTQVMAFPNPFSSHFAISSSEKNFQEIAVRIYNSAGMLVEKGTLHRGQNGVFQGSFGEALPSGLYVYRVSGAGREIAVGKVEKH